jgi:hypothetical protein
MKAAFSLFIALLITGLAIEMAHAEPVLRAVHPHTAQTITLYDDTCTIAQVKDDLPLRAVWIDEAGKVFEGCFDVVDAGGTVAVLVYTHEDESAALIPAREFKPLEAI